MFSTKIFSPTSQLPPTSPQLHDPSIRWRASFTMTCAQVDSKLCTDETPALPLRRFGLTVEDDDDKKRWGCWEVQWSWRLVGDFPSLTIGLFPLIRPACYILIHAFMTGVRLGVVGRFGSTKHQRNMWTLGSFSCLSEGRNHLQTPAVTA